MWNDDESGISVRCPRPMTRVPGRFSTSDVDPLTFDSSMNCERRPERASNSLTPHRSNSTPTTPYVITVGIDNTFPLPPSPLAALKPFPPEAHKDNSRLLLCPAVSGSRSSDKPHQCNQHHASAEQPASDWIDQHTQVDPLNNRTPSPMFSKDSPSSSNRSSTSSSNSSGYLGSSNQVNQPSPSGGGRQSRLSGQSCESGVSGISSSSCSYLSGGSSSSQSSLDRLEETGTHSNAVHVQELLQQGLKEVEVLHAWLNQLRLAECYPLFVHAGYDMPTISRMTPEDLTAIGITQPTVRKRLTSEISKLHICDGIPNHKPNSLLEWLQCLHLEEYYKVLARDGYEDLDRVTDIIWEDLEEIGIHKLGHQKKIMLAIDRLKKLNVSTRRLSSLDSSVSPADHQTSTRSFVIKTSTTPSYVTPHVLEQATRRIRRSLSGENMSSLIRDNDQVGMSRVLHLRPQVSSTPQPELVIIQVNNASRSWTNSVSDDSEGSAPIKYESFHGNPFQDFHCLLKETDGGGDTTPTNDKGAASSDEMESSAACVRFRPQLAPKPKLTCRMRRASGGSAIYGETEVSVDPLLWNGSFRGLSERGVDGMGTAAKGSPEFTRPTSATVCYNSVPNTPAHSSSRGGASSRKTAPPPPPPKRTNSVKGGMMSPRAESDYVDSVEFSKPLSPLLRTKPGSTSAEQMVTDGSLSSAECKSTAPKILPVLSPPASPRKLPAQMSSPESSSSVLSLARQKDQPIDASPLKRKVLPPLSAASGSGTDCNTLPFANENVGTIKQRVANKPLVALPSKPTVRIDQMSSGQASSGCSEKTLPPGKANTGSPNKKPIRPVPKQKPKILRTDLKKEDVKMDDEMKDEGDVFNDIDDLFQGLSQELDQMLTLHG